MPDLKLGGTTLATLGGFQKAYFGGVEVWSAAVGFTLAADAGSYAITGSAASLMRARLIAAGAGSYAITGTNAELRLSADFVIAADAGSYAITGTAASLEHGWIVSAGAGSYAIAGTDAALKFGYAMVAGAGSYSLSGSAASVLHGWKVAAAAGSYALTGQAATLTYISNSNYALAYRTTDLTSVGTGGTAIGMNTEVADVPGFHSTASNTERFTVTSTFNTRYGRFSGSSRSETAQTELDSRLNGSSFNGAARQGGDSAGTQNLRIATGIIALATNDYFELVARDLSATVNFTGGDFTWGMLEILPSDFNGCLAYKGATQSISASTTTAITFDSEAYDLDSWHSTSSNTSRQTVPASGVSLVRVSSCLEPAAVGGQMILSAIKNGSSFNGVPTVELDIGSVKNFVNIMSGPLAVSGSDYFEVTVFGPAQTLPASGYSWLQIEELPSDLKWARARRASNFALSAGVTTAVQWDTEDADVGGWVDIGTNNTRLTVPSGVSKVRIVATLAAASATGQLVVSMTKNGASFVGAGSYDNDTAGADTVNAWSAILEVTAGDYFEINAFSTTSRNLTGGDATWVSIEEVRF